MLMCKQNNVWIEISVDRARNEQSSVNNPNMEVSCDPRAALISNRKLFSCPVRDYETELMTAKVNWNSSDSSIIPLIPPYKAVSY